MDMKKQPIKYAKVDKYREGMYKLTTVVPLAANPYMNEYLFTQEELDGWLDTYSEHAEFIVGVQFLGNNPSRN